MVLAALLLVAVIYFREELTSPAAIKAAIKAGISTWLMPH